MGRNPQEEFDPVSQLRRLLTLRSQARWSFHALDDLVRTAQDGVPPGLRDEYARRLAEWKDAEEQLQAFLKRNRSDA